MPGCPIGTPSLPKVRVWQRTDQPDLWILGFSLQNDLSCPYIDALRHTGYEGHESVLDGGVNTTFQDGTDGGLIAVELVGAMTRKT